jgi:hypothetical protein
MKDVHSGHMAHKEMMSGSGRKGSGDVHGGASDMMGKGGSVNDGATRKGTPKQQSAGGHRTA